MTHARRHLLEKLQVETATLAGLALAWLVLWPAVRPVDPEGAMSFLPGGHYARLVVFALCVWGLAAGCSVLTLSSRFEGSLLASLAATAAFSARSNPMQNLLWSWTGQYGRLYGLLAGECLAMLGILLVMVGVVVLVRQVAWFLWPQWAWKDPLAEVEHVPVTDPSKRTTYVVGFGAVIYEIGRKLFFGSQKYGARLSRNSLTTAGACLLLEMALALVMLVMTFRSGFFRGQVIFALAASFLVGTLVAHQIFPARFSLPCWLAPLLLAAVVFLLGTLVPAQQPGPAWLYSMVLDGKGQLPLRGALPVDWFAAGTGGAMLGFWLSGRIHEARQAEKQEKTE
jgi:hypothetical protein